LVYCANSYNNEWKSSSSDAILIFNFWHWTIDVDYRPRQFKNPHEMYNKSTTNRTAVQQVRNISQNSPLYDKSTTNNNKSNKWNLAFKTELHLFNTFWIWYGFIVDLYAETLRSTILFYRFVAVITRRRSFAEYWKHFVARLNGVHAFGYNSTGSEPIWMKFGVLRVHCLADVGWDPRRSERDGANRNFVFFVSGKQRAISPTSGRPNFTKFAHKTWIREAVNPFGTKFWKFPRKESFSKKATSREKSSTTSDFSPRYLQNNYKSRKLTTDWRTYGIWTATPEDYLEIMHIRRHNNYKLSFVKPG